MHASDRPWRALRQVDPYTPDDTLELIFLLGNRRKAAALGELGVEQRSNGRRNHGEIHISNVPFEKQLSKPIIIADGDVPPNNKLTSSCAHARCHDIVPYSPALASTCGGKAVEIADQVINRLVLPFSGIVCLFLEDLGGIRKAARRLAAWLEIGRPSLSPILPWLLLVVDGAKIPGECLIQFEKAIKSATNIDILTRFQGLRVVSLCVLDGPSRRQQQPRCEQFWKELDKITRDVHRDRSRLKHLYSLRHLIAFMDHATKLICEEPRPFDFISAARAKNNVSPYLKQCLSEFLDHITSFEKFKSFAIPVIASSFILDHYTPCMHSTYSCTHDVGLS